MLLFSEASKKPAFRAAYIEFSDNINKLIRKTEPILRNNTLLGSRRDISVLLHENRNFFRVLRPIHLGRSGYLAYRIKDVV